MRESGDSIVEKAGKIEDIGVKKAWLTEQDIAIEKEFHKLIGTFSGTKQIFSEELSSDFVEGDNVWVIDPISHTFNYLHGLPHYAVVVGYLRKGETIFSAMYDPSVKELFVAEKKSGVTLNSEKVQVNTNNKNICTIYDPQMPDKRFDKKARLEILSQVMNIGRNKVFGSAGLQYAYVACGRVQACIDMNKDAFTSIPGELMVQEAGGIVTDFYGEKIDEKTMGIVVSNGVLHKDLLEITKKYR